MVILIVMNSILSNLGPRYSRRNSTTPIILGFLLLIIVIAVATYFIKRDDDDDDDDKDKKDENTGENVPSIEDPTVTRTLLPDSSNSSESGTTETYEIGGCKTETYQIEYDSGISDIELSKNVKIGITWSNKSGFDNVYKLDIEHFIDDVKKNTKSINRYDNGAKSGTEISNNKDYFTIFKGGLTHEFQGLEPTIKSQNGVDIPNPAAYSFVGIHTIKIIATYIGKDSDGNDSDKTKDLTAGTGTKTVEVKTEDLAATLELTAPDVRVFKPIQGSFNLGDPEIDNKLYYASTTRTVMNYSVEIDIHKSIDINNLGPRPFTLMRASADNSNQFYFKFSETEYLGYDSNKKLSIDSANNKKIITLVSSSLDNTTGTRYFRLSFDGDLYALIDVNSNGAVKTMDDISVERVYNTLDWEISTDLGFGIRLGNTYFYLIGKTEDEYRFGYYKNQVLLPEDYKSSIENIPIMIINKNTRSLTISQGSEHDAAFSDDGLTAYYSINNIKDDDTKYRIYQKEKTGTYAEWDQKGYFEGKDVQ